MRQTAGMTGLQAVVVCSVIACSVFGQATEKRQEMDALRQQAEGAAGRGEWSEAAHLYQSAISNESGFAWAHLGLADIYRANGAWDKAAEHYEAASKIDPSDAAAKTLASLSRQALGEARAGVVKAETLRAVSTFPWSWLRNNLGRSRDLGFQSKAQAPMVQRIPMQVAFPRNKFTLDSLPPAATRQLEEVAAVLGSDTARPLRIEVEGHTCRCGSDQANLGVGRKRAEAIREFLISNRVIPAGKITALSFGSSRPVESAGAASLPASVCDRDEIHSRNRRVVVVVYGQANFVTKNTPRLDVSFLSRRAGTHGYELLSDGGQLRGGDEFKIRLRAGTAVYAYALHRGSSGKWDVLFPEKPGTASSVRSSNPLESGQELSIPTADAGFLLTGDPGTEETYVYSSPEPDQALESLVKSIQDGADVKLLPPALVGPEVTIENPQPKQGRTTSGTQRNNQVEKDGTGGAPPPPEKAKMPIREGEEQVIMKDLTRPEDLRVPRLPPDPAGYVRFKHLK